MGMSVLGVVQLGLMAALFAGAVGAIYYVQRRSAGSVKIAATLLLAFIALSFAISFCYMLGLVV